MELGKSVIPKHFFKVMMSGFSERLNLPPVFSRRMEAEKSKDSSADHEAIVTTRKGIYKIKICKNRKGVISFREGWPNFVHQHNINLGDFIVFDHTGNMGFNAFIFDPNACEKEFHVERANASHSHLSKKTKREPVRKSGIMYHNQSSPHFILTMKPYHKRGEMAIPIKFVRSNDLSEKKSLILRDGSSGKTWPLKLYFRKTGQYRCRTNKAGWCDFYASNKLKNGDVCHFELCRGGSSKRSMSTVVLDVKIFQASS